MKKIYIEPTVVVIELRDMSDICMVQSYGYIESGGNAGGIPGESSQRRSNGWDEYERY